MFLLPYEVKSGSLIFGKGPSKVKIDVNNSLYSSLTKLVNDVCPSRVQYHACFPHKVYLCVIRGLFHSQLLDFELSVFHHQAHDDLENLTFALSKTFGVHARMRQRDKASEGSQLIFDVRRSLAPFKYRLGFYLMSGGDDLDRICQCLDSLYPQIERHPLRDEIAVTIVGSADLQFRAELEKYSGLRHMSDASVYENGEKRFPISKKKNLVLGEGLCERLVILHDRITLEDNWVQRLLEEHPYFDLYTCRVTSKGRRYLDKFGIRYNGMITNKKRHYYLCYKEDGSDQLVDGGFFVIHSRALGSERFDERLHWQEMEDVDFVLRQKLNSWLVSFDIGSSAHSIPTGHFSLGRGWLEGFYKIWFRRFFLSRAVLAAMRRIRVRRQV